MLIRMSTRAKRPVGGLGVSLCAVLALAVCLSAAPAAADGITHIWGPSNGEFQASGSWVTPGGPPGPLDSATFPFAGAYEVTFASHVANQQLSIGASDMTFLLNGRCEFTSEVQQVAHGTPRPQSDS